MDIVTIILSFTLFAVLHSSLAAEAVKDRVIGKLPSMIRFYRLIYNFIAVATLAPVFLVISTKDSPVLFSVTGPFTLLIYTVKAIALIFLLISVRPVLSELSGMAAFRGDDESGPLITDGMYAVTRHPIYLFTLIFIWASPRITINTLITYLLVTLYTYIGSMFEERRLMKKFKGYAEYHCNTSGIIPFKWLKSKFKLKLRIEDQ